MYPDEAGVELFKAHFYELERGAPRTGGLSRKNLEGLNLKNIADILESKGKQGA